MEYLLHYTWRHKMLPLKELYTTDQRLVEVIDPGLHNRTDSGPDFFNAKIKIDGMLWVGNVELHIKASDWYRHRHDTDAAYNNVILHVVEQADMDVQTSEGKILPTLEIPIASQLKEDYNNLLQSDKYPPCYKIIDSLPTLKVHSWMSSLQTERLERKTTDMEERVAQNNGAWEDAYFATLARNHGMGINGDAFEAWAKAMPLSAASHHRDDLFQIEALFLGQSGLLGDDTTSEETEKTPNNDRNIPNKEALTREYRYLKKKFGLTPIDVALWKYKCRPQNHPHVRLLQLAKMYHERRTGLSELLECKTLKDIGKLYNISGQKLTLFAINTAVPAIFAYGRHHAKEHLCERAFDILESLPPEDNAIVRMWQECGLQVRSAGDSQALIQLKKEYCDRKECLRCRFGYEFLNGDHRNKFLHEEETGQQGVQKWETYREQG